MSLCAAGVCLQKKITVNELKFMTDVVSGQFNRFACTNVSDRVQYDCFCTSALAIALSKGIVLLGCSSHYCESHISRMTSVNVLNFHTNVRFKDEVVRIWWC